MHLTRFTLHVSFFYSVNHNDVIEKIFYFLHHLFEIIDDRYALQIRCSNGTVLSKNGKDQCQACINFALRLALLIILYLQTLFSLKGEDNIFFLDFYYSTLNFVRGLILCLWQARL